VTCFQLCGDLYSPKQHTKQAFISIPVVRSMRKLPSTIWRGHWHTLQRPIGCLYLLCLWFSARHDDKNMTLDIFTQGCLFIHFYIIIIITISDQKCWFKYIHTRHTVCIFSFTHSA